MPADTGMTAIFERAVENSVANLMDAIDQAVNLVGPRPFGAVPGSREEQIEYYLTTRDDPNAWEQEIVRRATEIAKDNPDGARQTAEIETAIDAWEMEQALDRAGGAEAAMAALAMKRLGNAQRAVAKAEHMLDRPRIVVRPALPPVPTPLELLGIDANKVLEGAISGGGVPRPDDSAPSAAMSGAMPGMPSSSTAAMQGGPPPAGALMTPPLPGQLPPSAPDPGGVPPMPLLPHMHKPAGLAHGPHAPVGWSGTQGAPA